MCPRGWADPTWREEEQLYLDLLWGRVDPLSSFIGHYSSETCLADGHPVDVEGGSVVVRGLVQGAGRKGRAGTSPPDGPVSAVLRCPVLTPGDSHQCDDWGGGLELQVHEGEVFGQERLLVRVQYTDIRLDRLPDLHLQ